MPADSDNTSTKESIHLETSTVPWHELQTLFASGTVISVASELDLIEIATQMTDDDAASIEALINNKKIQYVTNDQARHWYAENTLLWCVVIKPWVLVQDRQ